MQGVRAQAVGWIGSGQTLQYRSDASCHVWADSDRTFGPSARNPFSFGQEGRRAVRDVSLHEIASLRQVGYFTYGAGTGLTVTALVEDLGYIPKSRRTHRGLACVS